MISGVMRSSGAVFWPTVNSLIGICLIEVPGAYIFMTI